MAFGDLTFHSARQSGVFISQLGSGTYDHIGFFGSNGTNSAINVGTYQDTTIIVDNAGEPLNGEGFNGAVGSSGQLLNNKFITENIVSISGIQRTLADSSATSGINIFKPEALNTYPDFPDQGSGTLLIRWFAPAPSAVQTFNAKLWAYDAGGALTDPPPDVAVFGYEINASGQWFNTAVSGAWQQMAGQNTALLFSNHSQSNGWRPESQHIWVCGLTVRANSVGVLDQWNFAFSLQFA